MRRSEDRKAKRRAHSGDITDEIHPNPIHYRIVLPPSGSLYSYPAMMSDKGQQEYIDSMEIDFQDYGSRVSVHWEVRLDNVASYLVLIYTIN